MVFNLRPQATVSESDLQAGLRALIFDGVCSQIMGTFVGGAFLVAFALLLGASNFYIGLIAALGPLAQISQILVLYLIEKTGFRKVLSVMSSFSSRLFWFVVAVIPWLVPEHLRTHLFLFALVMYFGLATISSLSFTSWMRDLIPDTIRGRYTARRTAIATAVGAGLSLLAGFMVDVYKKHGAEMDIYSIYFALGGSVGLLGVYFLSRIPEPQMERRPSQSPFAVITEPFKDVNFRQLLTFLGSWNFAINLAAPFFTVYMLKRLGLSMTLILALSVLSQTINVVFLRLWGGLTDRFSNKSVLMVAGPMFILTTAIWPFTTMPEKYFLTIPLLILIHAFTGMSTAGVTLCTGNIALKLAPRGQATAYLAVNALISGVAATTASILGGLIATWLSGERLNMMIRWLSEKELRWSLPAVDLEGLDFLFILSFMVGLYAIHRLVTVKELGEVERDVVLKEFHTEVRKGVRNISNVAGLRTLFYFPYALLRDVMGLGRNNEQNGALKSPVSPDIVNPNNKNGNGSTKKGQ